MAEKPIDGPESTPDLERLDAGWERAGMTPRERARAKAAAKKARREERARSAASKQKQKQQRASKPSAARERDESDPRAADDDESVESAPAVIPKRRPRAMKQLAILLVAVAVVVGVAFLLLRG